MSGLKYNNRTLGKLEELFKASQYVVRYERGTFNSGYCILEKKKVIVINKFYEAEARINCLMEIMGEVLILEDNLDEKQMKFYQQLEEMAEVSEEKQKPVSDKHQAE